MSDDGRYAMSARFYGGSMDGKGQLVRYAGAKFICVPAVINGKEMREWYRRDRSRHVRDEHGRPTEIALQFERAEEWAPPSDEAAPLMAESTFDEVYLLCWSEPATGEGDVRSAYHDKADAEAEAIRLNKQERRPSWYVKTLPVLMPLPAIEGE